MSSYCIFYTCTLRFFLKEKKVSSKSKHEKVTNKKKPNSGNLNHLKQEQNKNLKNHVNKVKKCSTHKVKKESQVQTSPGVNLPKVTLSVKVIALYRL